MINMQCIIEHTMTPIFFLVKYLHCKFICVEENFVAFDSFLCKQFSEDQLPWTKMFYNGGNLLRNWQLVINLTVHLLIPLSFESLRSINIFGGGSNDCSQALAIFFRMNLSRDFLAAMATDALCFNITKHL